jgi:hypothetical protein
MEWPYTGFGFVIGFIEHLQIVTKVNIPLSLIHTFCSSLHYVLSLLSLLRLHKSLSGNGFQLLKFLNFRVHGFTSSLAVV